ncbi:MAG: hypothetical protein QM301_00045 [Bacteroidota bacterium]|jgi:peptidoglycan/LPS O-acetylase OafA/YrhL|nr:hypothetical protein [Prolixibacteraceae bacterium]MDI9562563.1 hypothetical protein [Bacteroidota bacterium]NLT00190.1 hypothetical protein [Bacteroidales bacterium]OQB80528.1 MAG: hypothetical protein BWX87_01388 [Bacteroidetes bacterium ADurb.Bin123]HNU77365.1 hypothetical protein [Prolixibacteraceae bacterium]
MKRIVLLFVIIALVLGSVALWLLGTPGRISSVDLVQVGVVLVVVGFAFFLVLKIAGSYKRGEPAEDELSKKVLQKTAAVSYYVSLYIWVFLIYLNDRITMDTEQLLGTGILAMAVTFGVLWLIVNQRGIRNE